MSKQLLVPVRSVEDAREALPRVEAIAESGDEIVVLVISDIPEREMVGSEPSPATMEPLAHAGTGFSTPAPASDVPVFMESEEIIEKQGQAIVNTLADDIARLHDRGYNARVEAVFSESPAATIKDTAGDLSTREVYVTSSFYEEIKDEDESVAKVLT
jgi:hypothetical protein